MSKVSFEEWKRQLDALLRAKYGLESSDLADCAYRDWYERGVSAKSAARKALRENGL